MKSACTSTAQKTNFCSGIDSRPPRLANLFYRKAADALADLFERSLQLLAVAHRICSRAIDLAVALREPGEPRDATVAQDVDGFRGRGAAAVAHDFHEERLAPITWLAFKGDTVALEFTVGGRI